MRTQCGIRPGFGGNPAWGFTRIYEGAKAASPPHEEEAAEVTLYSGNRPDRTQVSLVDVKLCAYRPTP